MKTRIETMTPHELVQARNRRAVAYLPVGILEWHGPHLPLGLDGLKAERLCQRLAEQTGGVVFPTLWYGDNRNEVAEVHFDPARMPGVERDMRDDIAGALGVGKEGFVQNGQYSAERGGWRLFQELLTQTLLQIRSLGFRASIVLCGHYPLTAGAKPAVEEFNSRNDGMRALAATEAELLAEHGYKGDHAARFETSLGLALLDEYVRMDQLPPLGEELIGILGPDPRDASAEYAEQAIRLLAEVVGKHIDELLRE